MLQLEDIATQQAIDTQAMLPVQSCIKADKYKTNDFVTRVLTRYTVDDVLWPMPFNVSNPVFLYDKNAFTAAGLDPENPPTTLSGVKAGREEDQGHRPVRSGLRPQARPVVPRAVVGEGRQAVREPGERPQGTGHEGRSSTTRPGAGSSPG